jgi:erythromycin esterase
MYFWTWQTEEVRAMLEWMRAYNARPGVTQKITFTSFDMQFPKVAAEQVRKFAERMDAADRDRIVKAYAWTSQPPPSEVNDPTPPAARKQRKEQVAGVEKLLDSKRAGLPVSEGEFKETRQCARIVSQYLNMVWPEAGDNLYEARDRSMAENVRWLADEAFPGQKIVLWAHNGHVSKGSYGGPSRSMGQFLREWYGPKMYVVGFASDHGSIRAIRMSQTGGMAGGPVPLPLPHATKESVEAAFREGGAPRFLLDLRNIEATTALGKWLQAAHPHRMPGAAYDPDSDGEYATVALPKIYDGIIFLQESTAAKPIGSALK